MNGSGWLQANLDALLSFAPERTGGCRMLLAGEQLDGDFMAPLSARCSVVATSAGSPIRRINKLLGHI